MPRKKPTHDQYKSINRFNALKHGFARRIPIIPGVEDEADWKRHLRGMKKSFSPEGYFEELLVRRLATVFWDIDRLTSFQVGATMKQIESAIFALGTAANYLREDRSKIVEPDPYEVQERIHSELLPGQQDLEIIMRSGSMLHRQWIQILNQLLATQARRRGERVPVAMIDVNGPTPNFGPFRSEPAIPASLLKEA